MENTGFYGLMVSHVPFGENRCISRNLVVDKDPVIVLNYFNKLDTKSYSDFVFWEYDDIVFYHVTTVDAYTLTMDMLLSLPSQICSFIHLVRKERLCYDWISLNIEKKEPTIFYLDKMIKKFSGKTRLVVNLYDIVYNTLPLFRNYTIWLSLVVYLKSFDRPILKTLSKTVYFKCKWYHTKSFIIKNIIKMVADRMNNPDFLLFCNQHTGLLNI